MMCCAYCILSTVRLMGHAMVYFVMGLLGILNLNIYERIGAGAHNRCLKVANKISSTANNAIN